MFSEGNLLEHDGSDQERLAYVKGFVRSWRQTQPEDDKFIVMESILFASGVEVRFCDFYFVLICTKT